MALYSELHNGTRAGNFDTQSPDKACTVAFDVSFQVLQRLETTRSSRVPFWKRNKGGRTFSEGDLPKINVLKDVKGIVRPGELLAVMGPSGSGKTSLLNCLSMRNPNFAGKVLFDGHQVDAEVAARLSGLVQQQDLFMPTLTPLECLEFHASMSPRGGSSGRVQHLLDVLGLRKLCHTLIGGEGSTVKGISGGERKRLAIALELLSDPPILFLDEPTSGLDAYMAEAVVFMLKNVAKKDRKVMVATIHQPSSDVFDAFTNLLLLGEGRTAYFGRTKQAVAYFEKLGFKCPQFYNPADYLIKLISDTVMSSSLEDNSPTGALTGNLQAILEAWQASSEVGKLDHEIAALEQDDAVAAIESGRMRTAELTVERLVTPPSAWYQFTHLLARNGTMMSRDPMLTYIRLGQALFAGLLTGTIYFQVADSPVREDKVQSVTGLIFFTLYSNAMGGSIGLLQGFPREATVMLKEYADGLYTIPPYFLARTLVELPMQVLSPFVQFCIMYFSCGFPMDMNQFWELFLGMVMGCMAGYSYGYVTGSAFADSTAAIAAANLYIIPMIIFGGYMINVDDIPDYFIWLSSLSYVRWGFEQMMIAFWRRVDYISCNDDDCDYSTGRDVLDEYSFRHSINAYWTCLAINCVLFLGARMVGVVVLQWRAKKDVRKGAGFI